MKDFKVVGIDDIEIFKKEDFIDRVFLEFKSGCRVCSYFASDKKGKDLWLLISFLDTKNEIRTFSTIADRMPSMAKELPALHLFEREIMENTGFIFEGHPCPNPVRYKKQVSAATGSFFSLESDEIHEVAVGPVHAGVIEPGHFRFQCYGEKVFNLQIELGFQYRGIEDEFTGGPDKKSFHYIQTAAGDTTIGHSWNYWKLIESLCGVEVEDRALALRGVLLELERLANHIGDIGALSGDVAYLPTTSFCGRIRGDVLNTTALLCGNRFGRDALSFGGLSFDLDEELKAGVLERLEEIYRDTENAVNLLWETKSVRDRFQNTGVVKKEDALNLGLVGPAARASGIDYDVRAAFNHKPYDNFQTETDKLELVGDVFSRAYIRWHEIKKSYKLIKNLLQDISEYRSPSDLNFQKMKKNSFAVALTEGWRGEIVHSCITDEDGKFLAYKIKDPSFNNWYGLSMAMRNAQISDFPLCNKSFNLSYCGHDL